MLWHNVCVCIHKYAYLLSRTFGWMGSICPTESEGSFCGRFPDCHCLPHLDCYCGVVLQFMNWIQMTLSWKMWSKMAHKCPWVFGPGHPAKYLPCEQWTLIKCSSSSDVVFFSSIGVALKMWNSYFFMWIDMKEEEREPSLKEILSGTDLPALHSWFLQNDLNIGRLLLGACSF